MTARNWNPARIQTTISGIHHAGLIELIVSRRHADVEALLRERFGDGFPVPKWLHESGPWRR